MRKKIRELMNKEEGFTLVELLAVIVILGIIVAIAVPAVGGVIDNAKGNANDAQTELVKDAARLYFTDKPGETSVTVEQLKSGGYLMERGDSEYLDDIEDSTSITKQEIENPNDEGNDG